MFLFQVLKNADELAGMDSRGFCKESRFLRAMRPSSEK